MDIIISSILPLIVIIFLAIIANKITKKLFPNWAGSVLEYTFTGFLFSVEVIVITLALYAFSDVKNEAAVGVAWMYLLFGMPTSIIGVIILLFYKTNMFVTTLVFLACMIINCSGIGLLIGCLKKLVKPITPPH
ncbi:MAG: hypothetical protein IKS45_08055 [Thermoguttaceae bacterium]|nr:hypothetical protein [Thermoguttaceae bacterium]